MPYIGNIEIKSKTVLAPMAGVSDVIFRSICRGMGACLTFTEMVSSKALVFQDKKTLNLLKISGNEHPSGVQIFGSDPQCMAQAAVKAISVSGADILDINMGCPVGKIVKSGDGCALMKDPDKAYDIISAVVKALKDYSEAANPGGVPVPVTVKFRKGWDKGNVNAVRFAQMAESAGASAVTVHGRTRMQLYSGTADWNIIRDVKKAVNIPVIANGDVYTAQDAVRILKYTDADMAMIGRGAMGNPWIFKQAEALLADEAVPPLPSLAERVDTAMMQIELTVKVKGERTACLEARKHYMWYLSGMHNAAYYRRLISKFETLDDFKRITAEIKKAGEQPEKI